jgi:hypothetical protein
MCLAKVASLNVNYQIAYKMSKCKDDVNKPSVDNSAQECCGIYPTNCVVTSERDSFLPFGKGETLTNVLKTIANRLKALYQQQTHHALSGVISQTGTAIPTINGVENPSLLTYTFNYVSVGMYKIVFNTPILDPVTTYVTVPSRKPTTYTTEWEVQSTTEIGIATKNPAGTLTNGLLDKTPLMIRIKK